MGWAFVLCGAWGSSGPGSLGLPDQEGFVGVRFPFILDLPEGLSSQLLNLTRVG